MPGSRFCSGQTSFGVLNPLLGVWFRKDSYELEQVQRKDRKIYDIQDLETFTPQKKQLPGDMMSALQGQPD